MVFNGKSNSDGKKFHGGRGGKWKNNRRGIKRTYQSYERKPQRDNQIIEKLSEPDVGITEFLTQHASFDGIIKARYSDFQVHEISLDGTVAKLTDQSCPVEFTQQKPLTDDEIMNSKSGTDLIPDETWEKIKRAVMGDEVDAVVELDVTTMSKNDRRKVHETVKAVYGKKIVATTVDTDDRKGIAFKKHNKETKQEDNRFSWPHNVEPYVHFILYKQDIDTIEACYKISDCLRMSSSNFSYAGVKDRRAKTTQWMSVHKVKPMNLINATKRLSKLRVGNFVFKPEPLKLGRLQGNQFCIALRNVTVEDDFINEVLKDVSRTGFINYFGLQRFGQCKEVPTHTIGIQLLLGKWKEACDMILQVKESDDPRSDVTKAKQCYKDTKDLKAAHDMFTYGRNKCVEAKLMDGLLNSNDNDYVNALEKIPRNSRLLYIHAFQSFIWNSVVSKRIKHSFNVMVGDLVLIEDEEEVADETTEENDTEEEIIIKPDENKKKVVKPLKESDLENYSIYDIVLPLPGYDIVYPDNLTKDWYKEMLEEAGLTLEMPRQKVRTYALSGTYRKVITKIENMSWKIMKYNEPDDNLIQSDLEALENTPEPQSIEDGRYKAIVLDICLKPSSYATMALREILKKDTSSSTQAKLNNYHKPKQIEQLSVSSVTETDVEMSVENSLVNSEKYSAFLESVFGSENNKAASTSAKSEQNSELQDDDVVANKKIKLDETETLNC